MYKLKSILKSLKEDFETGYEVRGEYVEVFVNPIFDEIKECGSVIRFTAIGHKKKVYVINAFKTTHPNLGHNIGYTHAHMNGDAFAGIGYIDGNEVVVREVSEENMGAMNERILEMFEEVVNGKYDWLKDYRFNLKKIKEKLDNILKEEEEKYGYKWW